MERIDRILRINWIISSIDFVLGTTAQSHTLSYATYRVRARRPPRPSTRTRIVHHRVQTVVYLPHREQHDAHASRVRRLLYSYTTTGCNNPQHSSPDRPSTRTLTVAITSPSKRRDLPSTTPPPSFTVPPRAHPSTGSHPAPPLPFDHNA